MVQNDGGFQCLKITLIVFYVLGLIGYIVFLGITCLGLYAIEQVKPDESNYQANVQETKDTMDISFGPNKMTQADIDVAKNILIVLVVVLAVYTVVHIFGLVGVCREHLVSMIIMTVLSILEVIYPIVRGAWFSAFCAILWAFGNGFFAYLIHKRDRFGNNPI